MNRLYLPFLFFAFIILVPACQPAQKPYFDQIINSQKAEFRGVEIGNDMELVKNIEVGPPLEEDEGYLHFLRALNDDSTDTYSTEYSFDEKGLYEIYAHATIREEETAVKLFHEFTDHYTRRFSTPAETGDNYALWNLSNDNSDDIELYIELEANDNANEVSIQFTDNDFSL